MAQELYRSVQGACEANARHGQKVSVNGQVVCMVCESDKNTPSGLVVSPEDPGEEKMRQVLAASGIVIKPTTVAAKSISKPETLPIGFEEYIKWIVAKLEVSPMPKDVKQFKLIQKTLANLKKAIGE